MKMEMAVAAELMAACENVLLVSIKLILLWQVMLLYN